MKKTKKLKILSVIVVMSMVMSFLPAGAFAKGSDEISANTTHSENLSNDNNSLEPVTDEELSMLEKPLQTDSEEFELDNDEMEIVPDDKKDEYLSEEQKPYADYIEVKTDGLTTSFTLDENSLESIKDNLSRRRMTEHNINGEIMNALGYDEEEIKEIGDKEISLLINNSEDLSVSESYMIVSKEEGSKNVSAQNYYSSLETYDIQTENGNCIAKNDGFFRMKLGHSRTSIGGEYIVWCNHKWDKATMINYTDYITIGSEGLFWNDNENDYYTTMTVDYYSYEHFNGNRVDDTKTFSGKDNIFLSKNYTDEKLTENHSSFSAEWDIESAYDLLDIDSNLFMADIKNFSFYLRGKGEIMTNVKEARFKINTLYQHPFFKGLNWKDNPIGIVVGLIVFILPGGKIISVLAPILSGITGERDVLEGVLGSKIILNNMDNNIKDATSISLTGIFPRAEIIDRFDSSGQEKWYKIYTPFKGKLNFSISSFSSNLNVPIQKNKTKLYSASGEEIFCNQKSYMTEDSENEVCYLEKYTTDIAGGTYYLKLEGKEVAGYHLKLNLIVDHFYSGSFRNYFNNIFSWYHQAQIVSPPKDPLVLDLNGDGFNVLGTNDGVYFDLDCNGYKEKTEWIKDDDAFLALDLNKDGIINDGRELFGDYTLLNDNSEAKNGFDALAQYDENHDNLIDENDSIFNQLLLWRDDNSNGISEPEEIFNLSDFDIKNISLTYEEENKRYNDEILIGNLSVFEYNNGEKNNVGEYWFNSLQYDTSDKHMDVDVPDEIKLLPNVRSFGEALSLHKAMALDSTGELKNYIANYLKAKTLDEQHESIENILFFITKANEVEINSRGNYFDARKLHVIEKILGTEFVGRAGKNPISTASVFLNNTYENIVGLYNSILAKQSLLEELLSTLDLDDNFNFENIDAFINTFKVFYYNNDYSKSIKLTNLSLFLRDLQETHSGSIIFDDFLNSMKKEFGEDSWVVTMLNIDLRNILRGTKGNDKLNGTSGNNTLIGGAGNDRLNGGTGDDTYIFEKGFGKDTISDNGGNDVIVLGEGITREMLEGRNSNNHLLITLRGFEDTITVYNYFANSSYKIEKIRFSDGSEITIGELLLTMTGTDEDDTITAVVENTTLIGLAGDDKLNGTSGNDTYIFEKGFGKDGISDNGGNDVIVFGEGITREMLEARNSNSNSNNYLFITLRGFEDTITVYNYFANSSYKIEKIRFADGTEITIDELLLTMTGTNENDTISAVVENTTLIGLAGDDRLFGKSGDNTFIGGTGNDLMYGGPGDDTYIFEKGFGKDGISESGGNDVIVFGEGITREMLEGRKNDRDLFITLRGSEDTITVYSYFSASSYKIEKIRFADGTEITIDELLLTMTGTDEDDTITAVVENTTLIGLAGDDRLFGKSGDNTFIGGTGNDLMYGGLGDDTYIFEKGFGKDGISESGGNDVIVFGEGITREMLEGRKNDRDLFITLRGSEDTITVYSYFSASSYKIEKIRFADGTEITIDELLLTMTGTDGNDTISAVVGNTTLIGLAGDDKLYGKSGNNTFIGGAGNDALYGGLGDDTYIFEKGFGKDTINGDNGGNDVIIFGEGITREMLEGRSANSNGSTYLLITLRGFEDTITVYSYFANSSYNIEKIRFADGTEITIDELLLTMTGTDEDDTITAVIGNTTLVGLAGDDKLYGKSGNNTLIGGTGNDNLNGGTGDDTYIFEKGFGKDGISESGGNDVIVFGEGITREMLEGRSVYSGNYHLFITLRGFEDTITVYSYFTNSSYKIEKIRFADGSEITIDELLLTMTGTDEDDTITAVVENTTLIGLAGDDKLNGTSGNDTLIGGVGNDLMYGGLGDDTYIFEKGFGHDAINGDNGGNDVIVFGEGITREMLEARNSNSNKHLFITLRGFEDTITVYNYFTNSSYNIEKIRFADGTEITIDELLLTMTGTNENDTISAVIGNTTLIGLAGDDTLYGTSGNDTLIGGAGNDALYGGLGDDTYIFEKGFGKDTINGDNGGNDVIVFGEGITREMLEARNSNSNKHLFITLRGFEDTITVYNYFTNSSYNIEKIRFADGTEIKLESLL